MSFFGSKAGGWISSAEKSGSVQNLSHFQSCDGGSVILKVHLAQRLHVHILSRAPLCAGDVFQPGRSQAKTGLTIGKGPNDPGPSSNFLHQPFQRIVRPDFAPMAVGEAVIAEGLPDLPFDHDAVKHSVSEFVRGIVHTNGIESFWSMFKRGYKGFYHKMSHKHLDRYVKEYEHRHNIREMDTLDQMGEIVSRTQGRRLKYAELVA